MKTKILLGIIILFALGSVAAAQSVVVTTKKVTYTRPKPIGDHKKTFVINYPKVKAASAAVSRRIESAISYEKAFGLDLKEEMTDAQWIEEADYKVNYNKNGLLSVELSIMGSGAYPDGSTKHIVVDTRTGKRVLPGEVFVYVNGLVDMAKKRSLTPSPRSGTTRIGKRMNPRNCSRPPTLRWRI
jgi:hypothetical protein